MLDLVYGRPKTPAGRSPEVNLVEAGLIEMTPKWITGALGRVRSATKAGADPRHGLCEQDLSGGQKGSVKLTMGRTALWLGPPFGPVCGGRSGY